MTEPSPELLAWLEAAHPGNAKVVELARTRPDYRASFEKQMGATGRPLPPLAERVANFAASTARHALAGFPAADLATQAARLAVCRKCDRLRPEDNRCSACGCWVKDKSVRALEACPLGRWPV